LCNGPNENPPKLLQTGIADQEHCHELVNGYYDFYGARCEFDSQICGVLRLVCLGVRRWSMFGVDCIFVVGPVLLARELLEQIILVNPVFFVSPILLTRQTLGPGAPCWQFFPSGTNTPRESSIHCESIAPRESIISYG
jgi:hypothetical protein